jgi:predicted dehydrogenase
VTGTGPVGVALVGLGSAGRQHRAALAGTAAGALAAVYDADAELADRFAADDVPVHRSYAEVLADPAVEAVALCTPPGTHATLAREALAAGRAVLLEKPPVLSEAELDAVLADAEAAGRPVGVMLQHRFRLPDVALAAGWSGRTVAALEVIRYRPDAHYAAAGWRLDPALAGGGLFAHLAVHYTDLACQLLGEPLAVTGAVDCPLAPGIDGRLALTLTFASGARLGLTGTTAADARSERLVLYDGDRTLRITDGEVSGHLPGLPESTPPAAGAALRTAVYTDFCAAVRSGTPPARCALAASRGVVRTLSRIRDLARTSPSTGPAPSPGEPTQASGAVAPAEAARVSGAVAPAEPARVSGAVALAEPAQAAGAVAGGEPAGASDVVAAEEPARAGGAVVAGERGRAR